MPKITVVHLLLFMVLASACAPVLAWGARGHRIIAALTEQQLAVKAKAEISALLGSEDLLAAATWADDMRGSPDNPAFWSDYASAWHFVNLAPGGDYEQSPKNKHGDAVAALAVFSAILRDQPLPKGPVHTGLQRYFGKIDLHDAKVKRFALKFLIHVVADLHQPLHSGYASDRGGNDIKLQWQGKQTNLHALWDSLLLEDEHLSEADYIVRLGNRIKHLPNSDLGRMQNTDVKVWLQESSELLVRIHARLPQGPIIGGSYSAEFLPTVDDQMMKAAVRTASLLNKLFAGLPVRAQ